MGDALLLARLRDEFGSDSVLATPDGMPRVFPETTADCAELCRFAHREGLRVRLEGGGSWLPPDAPADFAISTRRLNRILDVAPADLVATVEAGVGMGRLSQTLADQDVWLGLDPPGSPDRSLGSVIATGTTGPLRHGLGPVRDHLLGLTVVTGDGRVIRSGGKVAKNVAGYDLTRFQAGGFGGFGIVTEVHLRLRALPKAGGTVVARGARDVLTRHARRFMEEQLAAVAVELVSASDSWQLVVRLAGTPETVESELARLVGLSEVEWTRLQPTDAAATDRAIAEAPLQFPVSFRLGVFPDSIDEIIDLLTERLGPGTLAAGAGRGGLRWSGAPDPEVLRELRTQLATREIPLTLERAPWDFRRAIGHFGEYREGVGALVGRLRQIYDPGGVLVVALDLAAS